MGEKKKYSAITIGDEILKSAKRLGRSLTPMQLTKLTYIAHGWSLAVLDRDLFSDRIEAWKYGPVIPVIYHATKSYGRNSIPISSINSDEAPAVDAEVANFIEDVVGKYSHLDGIQLSNLTHQPGTPWSDCYREGEFGIQIEDDVIKKHYLRKLHEHRGTAA